ncbi:MAG: hypothetical protein JWN19_2178, partial [Arthrobacter sp.]|nr:hypothetical protein [Arthrobacter sp.]
GGGGEACPHGVTFARTWFGNNYDVQAQCSGDVDGTVQGTPVDDHNFVHV